MGGSQLCVSQKNLTIIPFLCSYRSPIVVIGRCLGAFSRAYPDPFLEKQLFGFDLESLLGQLDVAASQGSTAGNVLYVVDIIIPVLSKSVHIERYICILCVCVCVCVCVFCAALS